MNYSRVRWGTVLAVHNGGLAEVRSTPLVWGYHGLSPGVAVTETVALSAVQAARIHPGDTVSLHWDWVCEVLTTVQARRFRHYTASQLRLVNRLGEASLERG